MRTPKILAVASAVDLDFRYGCTPAWWQLWKGMYEAGVDLVVTPYRGRPVESPWWRIAPNPTFREGESYQAVRDILAQTPGVVVEDDYRHLRYPQAIQANSQDEVFVGRIRADLSVAHGLHLWVAMDNLRKGAALNAVQVAEHLIKLQG